MIARLNRQALLLAIAGVAAGVVAFAVMTQHLFEMQPCPWCILQRMIYLSIAVVALLAWLLGRRPGGQAAGWLLLPMAAAGLATALWQHFVASRSTSCALTFADRVVSATTLDELLPGIFQPRASCADAAVTLLGVPYEVWSAMTFTLLVVAAARAAMLGAASGRHAGA
ncbi:MAG TPA: disulfide bond formation protein B [Burkholderiaceae bacterium]|nr:disulfide bond formation protein B [Burkholderiaceae bacterium]